MNFDKVNPGDVLWDVHRIKAGNVRGMTTVGNWPVRIVSIDEDRRGVMASWNSNPPSWMSRRRVEKLQRSPYRPRPERRHPCDPPVEG